MIYMHLYLFQYSGYLQISANDHLESSSTVAVNFQETQVFCCSNVS